jgi:magnesium transporter
MQIASHHAAITVAREKKCDIMKILALRLHPTSLEKDTPASFEGFQWAPNGNTILWLDVSEFETITDLQILGEKFGLHRLALDDCVNVRQRPKLDDFKNYLFLISRTIFHQEKQFTEGQQIGIFKGKDYLITVHKESIPQVDAVLEEIMRKPELVERSSSFVLYRILDAVVDDFEDAVKTVEEMECIVGSDVLKNPPPKNVLDIIYTDRSNLLLISRYLRSQSHVLHHFAKGDYSLINSKVENYFRDIYDHTVRTIERVDNLMDLNMGSLSICSTMVGNKMNEIIRLLTVISTIGVLLTVLVGWYSMNFLVMPKLDWFYGYGVVGLGAVAIITTAFILFKRKGWL